jgi:hypothetical protein
LWAEIVEEAARSRLKLTLYDGGTDPHILQFVMFLLIFFSLAWMFTRRSEMADMLLTHIRLKVLGWLIATIIIITTLVPMNCCYSSSSFVGKDNVPIP